MNKTCRHRARIGAGLVIAAAITGGCRVSVGSEVEVERSGAGSISVAVTADDAVREALVRGGLGDLGEGLFGGAPQRQLPPGAGGGDAFADLRDAGWDVAPVANGIRMTRRFAAGEDLDAVVAGLGGGDAGLSPIQSLAVEKRSGFPSDNIDASGEVGLSVDALATLASRAASNAPTPAELEDVLGTPLEDLVVVRFHLALPGKVGEVDSDPPPASDDDLTWELQGGRQLRFSARSAFLNGFVVWSLVVLAVVVVGGAILILWRRAVVVRRRRGRGPRPRASSRAPTERIRAVPPPQRR